MNTHRVSPREARGVGGATWPFGHFHPTACLHGTRDNHASVLPRRLPSVAAGRCRHWLLPPLAASHQLAMPRGYNELSPGGM